MEEILPILPSISHDSYRIFFTGLSELPLPPLTGVRPTRTRDRHGSKRPRATVKSTMPKEPLLHAKSVQAVHDDPQNQ